MKTRLIGLDISATSTGITIADLERGLLSLVHVTHIPIPSSIGYGKNKISFTDGERLTMLRQPFLDILEEYKPDVFIKEGQGADMNKFRSVSLVSKATGVIEEACQSYWGKETLDVFSYPPSTIKKQVTGNGRADKEDVQKKVFHLFGTEMYSFKLRKTKGDTEKRPYFNDDETDATAVILTHLKKNMIPFEVIK